MRALRDGKSFLQAWAAPREGTARLRSRETHVGTLTGIEMPCRVSLSVGAACAQVMADGIERAQLQPGVPAGVAAAAPLPAHRASAKVTLAPLALRDRARWGVPRRTASAAVPRATVDCARRLCPLPSSTNRP